MRAQLGDQPAQPGRPCQLDPCPGRPGWLDLDALGAPGSPRLAQSGLEWLALGALGALAGSLWTPWALLARPGWPTTAPSTRLAKKNRLAFRRSCFDAACFVRSGTFLHASKLVYNIPERPHSAPAERPHCLGYDGFSDARIREADCRGGSGSDPPGPNRASPH